MIGLAIRIEDSQGEQDLTDAEIHDWADTDCGLFTRKLHEFDETIEWDKQ